MSPAPSSGPGPLPVSGSRRLDSACDRFEAAWHAGTRPALEDFLGDPAGPERLALVRELVVLDIFYRRQYGQDCCPEDYTARFPDLDRAWLVAALATRAKQEPCARPGAAAAPQPARPPTVDPLRTDPYQPLPVPRESAGDFAPGTLLNNRYMLARVLGCGGMGQVYLGRDSVLDRSVAVKVIRPRDPKLRDHSLYEASFREAFAQEARIGARLTHPAIATVFDFGFHEQEPFIVFEYIAGETLAEMLDRRGRLPLEDVRLILGPLAQALDYAHSHHVVHRDLKPENIRATTQGHFKILDLGLAKEFRHQVDWHFAGTPAYASPEQAAGLACDGRTDQYALALITYELLTGRRVFENSAWSELLRMHREQEPLSAARIVPDLPESVCMALLRALRKDPNQRFASCEEFAVALGCRLLDVLVPLPAILRLAVVPRMQGDWTSARFRIIRKGTGVYLVLSRDTLWVAYRGEIRCLLLRALTQLRRSRWGNELRLRFHRAGQVVRQSFRFASGQECRQWFELLQDLKAHALVDAPASAAWPRVGPVVLMGRPPAMRYQVLGPVEFHDAKPRRAEVGLQVRAAMMGADAVVDVQEERLPQLAQTVHRRTGMAIQAVDTAGRRELRSRWFATQVSQLSRWMLTLVGVSFILRLVAGLVNIWTISLSSMDGNIMPLPTGETIRGQITAFTLQTVPGQIAAITLFVALIHSWPLAVAWLTRGLLWPQLLRPAALAFLALGTWPLAGLLGWLVAGVMHGRWGGATVVFLSLVDPLNLVILLGILLFVCFLSRRAWRAYGEFRKLAPDAEQDIPSSRRVGGHLALATSVLYLLLLGGLVAWAHYSLATDLDFSGERKDQGSAEFRRANAPDPMDAAAHSNLGITLFEQGKPDEAIAEFRRAVALDPMNAGTHYNLGNALHAKGKLGEAAAAYRQAISLDPQFALAHGYLGHTLIALGQFAQALQATRDCLRLLPAGHPQRPVAVRQRRRCERLLELERKLPAVLKGEQRPAGPAEQLELAELCSFKQRNATATRFYADALAGQPKLATLPAGHRYNAACAATLAGCGQGKDAAPLDKKERARLRSQALAWLRADLAAWRTVLQKDPEKSRATVRLTLEHWQADTDLAGVRGNALDKLAEAERKEWQRFWSEVAALVRQWGEARK
jgi:tetratricopeptide (TPR) repeat protein/tRNA A-37 threonylcarbamoyl transferase component Bud32